MSIPQPEASFEDTCGLCGAPAAEFLCEPCQAVVNEAMSEDHHGDSQTVQDIIEEFSERLRNDLSDCRPPVTAR